MKVPYPRSLAGQMALLVAIALFVAQAINFTLLLRERRDLRSTEVTAPSAARIVDAAERIQSGRYNPDPRTRVQLHPNNPIPTDLPRQPDIEEAIRTAMKDADLPISSIVTGVRDIPRDDPFLAKLPPRRAGTGAWIVPMSATAAQAGARPTATAPEPRCRESVSVPALATREARCVATARAG